MSHRTATKFLVLAAVLTGLIVLDCRWAAGAELGRAPNTRDEAIRAIPFNKLNRPTQTRLWPVVSDPSIYRQMPAEVISSDPELFLFLVRHPEVIVNIWELMGITHVKMNRTGDYTFQASDGAGTNSTVELVYGTSDLHVLYAEGTYEGPLLKRPIQGQCVMVLRTEYSMDGQRRTLVSNRFDIFLKLDHVGAEIIAKTLHPLVGKAADYNFSESIKFIGKVADAAEQNGPGVQRLASRLTGINEQMRQEFSDLAATAYHRSVLRESGQFLTTPLQSSADMPPADSTSQSTPATMLQPALR
jgi:hypothetical protein